MKNFLRNFISLAIFVSGLFSLSAVAQVSKTADEFPAIKIRNFGQMDSNYYRGGQPKEGDYQSLKSVGVTTVIDLRNDPTSYEKRSVEALGMKYINLPMDDAEYPKEETIAAFLKEINDPANGVMYVHCKGGKHRAGVTGAVYRFTKYGWNYDQVMAEMKRFNFNTSWGRKVMKTYVEDYAEKMKQQYTAAAASTGAVSAN